MYQDPALIALVEDDDFHRVSVVRLMRSSGYAVAAFASAAEFLASPGLERTRCLIADIHMPVMTGVELFRHLKQAGRKIPTILITAYPDEAVRVRALRDGVLCYLKKPFDDEELLRCLRMALGDEKPPDEN